MRKPDFTTERLNWVLREQHSVISRAQALACGVSPKAVHLRIAPGGRRQRVLPGIYVAQTGTVTQR